MLLPRKEPAPKVRDETQKRVRDWIIMLPELTGGKKLTKIAREAGLAVTTLTKPAKDPQHPHVMSTVTIAKIVEKHGVPPPLGFEHLARAQGFSEAEATPFDARNYDDDEFVADVKRRLSRPGVDAWVLNTRALIGFGYMPGDVVILDLNAEWFPEDIVCAQLFSPTKTETIWRRFEPPWLVAGSSEPEFVRPISVDMVARKGAVLRTLRPRPSRRRSAA